MKSLSVTEIGIACAVTATMALGMFSLLHAQSVDKTDSPIALLLRDGPGPTDSSLMSSSEHEILAMVPGTQQMFSVFVPTNGPTNIDFRAYSAQVGFSGANPTITMGSSPLPSGFFVSDASNNFTGNNTMAVTPGEWTTILFKLDPDMFEEEEHGDMLLGLLPFVTGGTNTPYQGGILYTVDSAEDGLQSGGN